MSQSLDDPAGYFVPNLHNKTRLEKKNRDKAARHYVKEN